MNFYWYLRASQMIVLQSGDALRKKASDTNTSTERLAPWWWHTHSLNYMKETFHQVGLSDFQVQSPQHEPSTLQKINIQTNYTGKYGWIAT